MAKTKYLKDQTNGGTQSPPLDRRFVSDNSRTLELSNFSTLELPRVGFTVLELLIVIGVLTVLLAIMLPTIKTVRTAALRNRAQAEATVLAQAAIHYKTEYGFWPGQLMANNANGATVELSSEFTPQTGVPVIISRYLNDTFTVTATGAEPVYLKENGGNSVYRAFRRVGEKQGPTFKPNPLNPKGIHFIDLTDETDPDRVNFPDPWGRGYILFMGLNPNSTFTHTVNLPSGGTQVVLVKNTIAFAFSFGPDGESSTNYLYSAGVK